MATTTRFATLTLLALLLAAFALPVMAAEVAETGDDAATEEVADDDASTGQVVDDDAATEVVDFEYEPATIIEPAPADAAEQPWTTKFLVPTGLALAAVAVFVTVVQYFVRVVRSRYKVVE